MAITFRHDAAAVTPPSNASTRKYGQSLVLQQQQQKYQGHQAGLNRLFDAAQQERQNVVQFGRDLQQNAFQVGRDKDQNQFQLDRDKNLFDQKQQEQEAERRRAFLEDARNQSSSIIMEDIENGLFDPATARKLRQNLVEESEALGNPELDPTQRAEALQKIRAERAMLSANRQEKSPPKPPQPNFYTDDSGGRWVEEAPGKWGQVPQQEQEPKSFSEYAQKNPEDARKRFSETLDAMRQSVSDGETTVPAGKTVEDMAVERLEEPFRLFQERFGQSSAPPSASAPGTNPGVSPAPMTERGPGGTTSAASAPAIPPVQNPWSEAEVGAASPKISGKKPVQPKSPPQEATSNAPDFGKLTASATDDADKALFGKLQEAYQGQTPDVQAAIAVFANPDSGDQEFRDAADYLKSKGIDVETIAAPPERPVLERPQYGDWHGGRGA